MEKKDGLDKQRIRDIETQSADPSGAGAICLQIESEELSLNSKDEAAGFEDQDRVTLFRHLAGYCHAWL